MMIDDNNGDEFWDSITDTVTVAINSDTSICVNI